ncbi:helix-turn-helix domain-containing protein [Lactobacillus sp. W8092]|nr:helix-turn-helix domain-containing protein [Lactobacillus sp. W8092]
MHFSYNKLWKLLIDLCYKNKDLWILVKIGISSTSIAKFGKDDNVMTELLLKIYKALDCGIIYIMETFKN